MTTSHISAPPGAVQHSCVKHADERRSLEQRLAAAEAVCELVKTRSLCQDSTCNGDLCRRIRTWLAFRG